MRLTDGGLVRLSLCCTLSRLASSRGSLRGSSRFAGGTSSSRGEHMGDSRLSAAAEALRARSASSYSLSSASITVVLDRLGPPAASISRRLWLDDRRLLELEHEHLPVGPCSIGNLTNLRKLDLRSFTAAGGADEARRERVRKAAREGATVLTFSTFGG